MRRVLIALLGLSITVYSFAEEGDTGKLTHESEAGVVLTAGNTDTQTYHVKQLTAYGWSGNTVRLTASYLLGKTSGIETAKKWDLGLRYERSLTESLAAFLGGQLESDVFSGIQLRTVFDLGGKYSFLKSDARELFAEAGYRMTAETFTADNGVTEAGKLTSHMSRVHAEWKENWNASISSRFWVEYLQSFTDTGDYRINMEPSFSVLLNQVFSVKIAYLLNYRAIPAVAGKKNTDSTYTTSLVAKF